MNSRTCLVFAFGGAVSLALAGFAEPPAAPGHDSPQTESRRRDLPDLALERLREGNERFRTGSAQHPNSDVFRVAETGAAGQHPFAVVLTCADSRVPAERLFDRGVGDLFVVRVAGNVCQTAEAASVEYAVAHLGTPLVVVMGHTECGAVKAAATGGEMHGPIAKLVDTISPAVNDVRGAHPELTGDSLVSEAVKANVLQSMQEVLKACTPVRDAVDRGTVKLVGAVYDIDTGGVEWLGAHPQQARLIDRFRSQDASESAHDASAPPAHAAADQVESADPAGARGRESGLTAKPAAKAPLPAAKPTQKPQTPAGGSQHAQHPDGEH